MEDFLNVESKNSGSANSNSQSLFADAYGLGDAIVDTVKEHPYVSAGAALAAAGLLIYVTHGRGSTAAGAVLESRGGALLNQSAARAGLVAEAEVGGLLARNGARSLAAAELETALVGRGIGRTLAPSLESQGSRLLQAAESGTMQTVLPRSEVFTAKLGSSTGLGLVEQAQARTGFGAALGERTLAQQAVQQEAGLFAGGFKRSGSIAILSLAALTAAGCSSRDKNEEEKKEGEVPAGTGVSGGTGGHHGTTVYPWYRPGYYPWGSSSHSSDSHTTSRPATESHTSGVHTESHTHTTGGVHVGEGAHGTVSRGGFGAHGAAHGSSSS